jgi:hypothetical protein
MYVSLTAKLNIPTWLFIAMVQHKYLLGNLLGDINAFFFGNLLRNLLGNINAFFFGNLLRNLLGNIVALLLGDIVAPGLV